MPFLIKIWPFISKKEEEKHLIWPSRCKYAFSDVYPGGRLPSICSQFQTFLNLVWGGGLEFFNNFWNSKYSELSEGGGSSLIGNFSQIFPFFFSDGSPYLWDQALYCLNLYLISSPIRSYSNVMKDFLLGIMHILLPSSAPVPAMLGWDSICFNFYLQYYEPQPQP